LTETGAPEEKAPVTPECYRHAGRETRIRCTRCDRPICPDCMNDAAVGFQCPECVKEGQKTVRQARTVFGGRISTDPGQVTRVLIGLNVGVFALTLFGGGGGDVLGGGLTPLHVRFANLAVGSCVEGMSGCTTGQSIGVAGGEYYRLVTSMFLHYGAFHLLMNMYALLMVGDAVERALGRWRYVTLYLIAGLGGSAASYAFGPNNFSAGASGAVFGLFGAYFVIQKRLRLDTSQMATLIGLNIIIGFLLRGYIDWRAHIGGLVAGAALTALFAYVGRRGRERDILHAAGAAVVLAIIAVVVVLRTAQLRDRFGLDESRGSVRPAASADRTPAQR
jgi:membrane associated rhomboid family serine protease